MSFEYYKGEICYYRIYDMAKKVDLQKAEQILKTKNLAEQFRLKRASRAIIIEDSPVSLVIGEIAHNILGKNYRIQAVGKLWAFGAISINFKIQIDEKIPLSYFKLVAHAIQHDRGLEEMALDAATRLMHDCANTAEDIKLWEQFEDYIIFNFDATSLNGEDPSIFLKSEDFYQLILDEPAAPVAKQIKDTIVASTSQFNPDDMVVLDWNSAFVCSKDDSQDICDVVEFVICQLLEMRYYDHLLDKKLRLLYQAIQSTKSNIFDSSFSKNAKEAYSLYLEISGIKELIENSLKVIGDFYYARIFRLAIERLRLNDWQKSVKAKLDNLAEISQIFQGQVDQKRSQLMEMIIILLIAIELIPLLRSVAH